MKHEEAVLWLVDLEEGRLDGEERQRVEDHAASCPECSSWLRTYRDLGAALRTGGNEEPEHHPPSEAIARFTTSPQELDGAEWDRIEGHLERCAACRDDAERLQRVLEGAEGVMPVAATRRRGRRRAAALAASVLLAAALPAAYLLGRAGASGEEGWAGPVDVLVIRSAERSSPTPRVLRVRPGQEHLVLVAMPPVPAEVAEDPQSPIEIRVESAEGTAVWSGETTAAALARRIEERGALFLSLPVERLPPGSYRLRIGPAAPGRDLLLDAPFRVVAGR